MSQLRGSYSRVPAWPVCTHASLQRPNLQGSLDSPDSPIRGAAGRDRRARLSQPRLPSGSPARAWIRMCIHVASAGDTGLTRPGGPKDRALCGGRGPGTPVLGPACETPVLGEYVLVGLPGYPVQGAGMAFGA